jgi:hypothetical protein
LLGFLLVNIFPVSKSNNINNEFGVKIIVNNAVVAPLAQASLSLDR